jgi:hypothetical protein
MFQNLTVPSSATCRHRAGIPGASGMESRTTRVQRSVPTEKATSARTAYGSASISVVDGVLGSRSCTDESGLRVDEVSDCIKAGRNEVQFTAHR